jgi:UDP-N-acetylglucosamine/UDP-N-acetylgalactosamine diphosphorylase
MSPDTALVDRLNQHGQSHLLRWWEELDEPAQARLASEIGSIDFEQLDRLIADLVRSDGTAVPPEDRVQPIDVVRLPQTDGERVVRRRAGAMGAAALAAGEVGVILVAGGSGTRLGFEGPKGTFPIGPVSAASLFQIHAEKIAALARRHGRTIPFYIMTSPENHEVTMAFFESHDRFGLEHVRFFTQGQMPAVDRATGKVLLSSKGRVALSPDGHGGTLAALAAPGPDGTASCLDEMRARGTRTLFYFQVDNPLVRIADPSFIGLHREADAEVSFKVVERTSPEEKLGVVVAVDGRPQVIEYSDLPPNLAGRCRKVRSSSGPAASPCTSSSGRSSSGSWASSGFPFIGPSRRLHLSTTTGR